ncbi:MotA/TolQ/ExbB proton channel family protein [Patulibacter medicamentivorans]|uniref:MotA/TolQ/ExbB proton channel family protein n=1 Tax=Patulibacter medicamentivorans TaxID=1097667 RepID=UPI00058F3A3E|nr:MotA/TolQ/ExbB proton channel family protein [Patulibacter medicamentivorans]
MSPPLAADRIGDALSGISSALAVPVQVAALLLLLLLAFELGRAAAEGWRRLRPGAPRLLELAGRALADPRQGRELARLAPTAIAGAALGAISDAVGTGNRDAVEQALADYELAVQRRLDRTRMLVRAGPAVGLMGTLIPLAPGLAALGRGDIAGLAADLRTAFAATVVGLLVGTVAFALTLARTRRATEDLAALERAVETAGAAPPTTVAPVVERAA